MLCSKCGNECKEEWEVCPRCEKTLKKQINPERIKHLKVIAFALVILLGIILYQSITTYQNEQAVIPKVKELLVDGYAENQDITKVTWGKYKEAKDILSKLSANSKYRHDADVLLAEITVREIGEQIAEAKRISDSDYDIHTDINSLKRIREVLVNVESSNKYYQDAQDVLPKFNEMLDTMLIQKAKESIIDGHSYEARQYIASISSNSKFIDEAKQVIDNMVAIETSVQRTADILKREQYAKNLENIFVRQGMMDVYVSVSGNNNDQLQLKYVLWSRPLVIKFADDGGILKNAKELGFKRVTFDTGYQENYWYDL